MTQNKNDDGAPSLKDSAVNPDRLIGGYMGAYVSSVDPARASEIISMGLANMAPFAGTDHNMLIIDDVIPDDVEGKSRRIAVIDAIGAGIGRLAGLEMLIASAWPQPVKMSERLSGKNLLVQQAIASGMMLESSRAERRAASTREKKKHKLKGLR